MEDNSYEQVLPGAGSCSHNMSWWKMLQGHQRTQSHTVGKAGLPEKEDVSYFQRSRIPADTALLCHLPATRD